MKLSFDHVLVSLLACSLGINVFLSASTVKQARRFPSVGLSVTDFSVIRPDLTRTLLPLWTQRSGTVVLYVFQPECGWCRVNFPLFQALMKQAGRNYRMVALSFASDEFSTYVSTYQGDRSRFFMLAQGVEPLRLLIRGTPSTYVIENGFVTHAWTGAYSPSVRKEIQKVLQVSLPEVADIRRVK